MIPRLAPRRSSRRLSLKSSAGSENTSPLMSSELAIKPASKAQIARTVVDSPSKPPSEATNRRPASSQQQEQEQRHPSRSVLPNEIAALNPPLSPSPPRLEPELLEHFESPRSKDIQSERCSINGDFSLTPPVTGPRPLVFSAKRHGHAVRRKHSKRRRRRSENGSLSSEGHTLWKDADAPPSQEATTSDEEEDLSYLLSPQAPPETQQQRFWEFCYGKAPMESSTIPTGDTGLGWSASRKPPAKGCLSHKKAPSAAPTNKFQTPPTSPDDFVDLTGKKKTDVQEQFGSPQAAEDDKGGTVAQFTPLSSENTPKRDSVDDEGMAVEEDIIAIENKRHSALLAKWVAFFESKPNMSIAERRWHLLELPASQYFLLASRFLDTKASPIASTNNFKSSPASIDAVEELGGNPNSKKKGNTRVQFGSPQAAEYDVDGLVAQLTPLPPEVTRKRYSMNEKVMTVKEENMTMETKRNSAVLAEWEALESEPTMSSAARRRQQRRNRRTSSIFTPSPMSELNSDDDEDTRKDSREDHLRATSTSTVVMENLASLCVDSPAAAEHPGHNKIDTHFPTLTPASLSSESSSSSHDTFSLQSKTAEFAISLDSLNSTGGAMDTTPPRPETQATGVPSTSATSKASLLSTEATPPSSNMSLDAIHSVGGALDYASSATAVPKVVSKNGLSPISRMTDDTDKPSNDTNSWNAVATSLPIDIVGMLLRDPASDQSWEAKDVFQNLVESKPKAKSPLHPLLESLWPRLDGVLTCIDDLKEQAKFCASTKSNTKFKLPASEAPYARRIAFQEWKGLETEFLLELSQAVQRNAEHAAHLVQRADAFLRGMKTQPETKVKGRRRQQQQLEAEIASLEKGIEQQKTLALFQEAAEAPYAVLRCQATSLIGICGFRLDDYTGACLQLAFEHPIAGVESRFLFDITEGVWSASYVSDAFVSRPDLLPSSHVGAIFHENIAKGSFENPNGILRLLEGQELQEAIMLLSRWLGLLDGATQELADVSTEHLVAIEWPVVAVSMGSESWNEGTLNLVYGECSSSESLLPSRAFVSLPGKEDRDIVLNQSGPNFKSLVDSLKS